MQILEPMIIIPITAGMTILWGMFVMSLLKKLNIGQTVREEGPKSHYAKSGTPVFGGLIFIVPITILFVIVLICLDRIYSNYIPIYLCILTYAIIGFADDFCKVRIRKEGLSVKQKTVVMTLVSVILALFILYGGESDPVLILPGLHRIIISSVSHKILYGVFIVLYMFYSVNSVNLTDGVDGLATSVTFCAAIFTGIFAAMVGNFFTDYAWVMNALAGSCLGFLFFNRYPAKVFMGDVGSFYLGAMISMPFLLMGMPWMFLFTGIIYIVEGFSVLLQVSYFKLTGGKRIFKMSPIHHHFELSGWNEVKIVKVFSIITVISSALGILFFKLMYW